MSSLMNNSKYPWKIMMMMMMVMTIITIIIIIINKLFWGDKHKKEINTQKRRRKIYQLINVFIKEPNRHTIYQQMN